MKTSDLLNIKNIELVTKDLVLDKEIKDLYTSDLLSFVLGHVKEKGVILLTVLNTINAVAVASILDMPAIIFCESVEPDPEIIDKAFEEGIALFKSSMSSASTARVIYENLL